tara:strand:- start:784 stop:1662 length:879 start_codon:yes stop_codon:yes gene_type:complete
VALLTRTIAQKLKTEQGANIIIPKKYTSIEEKAFAIEWDDTSTQPLTSVKIPGSITTIGDSAFSRNRLRSIEIPESVTRIGDSAFQKNLLTSVEIPGRVTFIDEESFEDNLLTSIKIGKNVTYIGGEAFQGNQLKNLNVPASVTYIDHDAFDFNSLKKVSIAKNAKFDLSVFPETVELSRREKNINIHQLLIPIKFKNKFADKITNFNPSTDTLEINNDSFSVDTSATFASGKNKKVVKKKLAQQDVDFLYDEKKGGLYFNENGAEKGFGDGGIIAILKGAPNLTSGDIEFV